MEPRFYIGRMFVIFGIALVVFGLIFMFGANIPFIGRLPGDIVIRGKNWNFYFPIVTCVILSIILTFLLNLFFRR
ncbi:MAG: DUF2905 domain-containing protein [Candidatus Latescibacteria bacterium]|nr:DUF2905 domain-containing protein [Candidatus Latescibacterota bacterium]